MAHLTEAETLNEWAKNKIAPNLEQILSPSRFKGVSFESEIRRLVIY